MSQYDLLIDANTTSGSQLAQKLNDFASALKSGHLGGTEPTYKTAGMVWIDNSTGDYVFKLYKSNTWITLYTVKDTGIDVVGVRKDIDAYAVTVDDTDETSPATYKISLPNLVALQTGQIFRIKTHKTCTGATTVRINGIAPVSIKKLGNIATELGDLQSGGITEIVYDGTQFLITSAIRNITRGSYSASVGYLAGDLVVFGLSLYQCTTATSAGEDPTTTPAKWTIIIRGLDNVLTTIGDIVYHDGTKSVRLAKGAAGQSLVMGSDNKPAWSTPAYRPYMSAAKLFESNADGCMTPGFITPEGSIKLWGGSGSTFSNGNPQNTDEFMPSDLAFDIPSPSKIQKVYKGNKAFYALNADGDVYSWGDNGCGQLGHGDTVSRAFAKRIDFFFTNNIKIAKIVGGRNVDYDGQFGVVFFITTTGLLYSCGYNNEGQLGDGTTTSRSTPVRVGQSINFDGILDIEIGSDGSASCFAIRQVGTDKQLWAWGWNQDTQLGNNSTARVLTPIRSGTFINVQQIVSLCGINAALNGRAGSTLVLDSGLLYGVGSNNFGYLGSGNTTALSVWTQVAAGYTNIQKIYGGGGYYPTAGLLDATGQLKLCGFNGYGIIGRADRVNYSSFVAPNSGGLGFQGKISKVIFSGARTHQTLYILSTDNRVYGSGYNGNGALGQGHTTSVISSFSMPYGQYTDDTENHKIIDINTYDSYTGYQGLLVHYNSGLVKVCGYGANYEMARHPARNGLMLLPVLT